MVKKSIETRVLWPGDARNVKEALAFLEEAKARHETFERYRKSTPRYRQTKHEPPLKAFYE